MYPRNEDQTLYSNSTTFQTRAVHDQSLQQLTHASITGQKGKPSGQLRMNNGIDVMHVTTQMSGLYIEQANMVQSRNSEFFASSSGVTQSPSQSHKRQSEQESERVMDQFQSQADGGDDAAAIEQSKSNRSDSAQSTQQTPNEQAAGEQEPPRRSFMKKHLNGGSVSSNTTGGGSSFNQVQRPANWKTELCRHFPDCDRKEKCWFAHGAAELRPAPPQPPNYKKVHCKYFSQYGYCNHGPKCKFIHDHKYKSEMDPLYEFIGSSPAANDEGDRDNHNENEDVESMQHQQQQESTDLEQHQQRPYNQHHQQPSCKQFPLELSSTHGWEKSPLIGPQNEDVLVEEVDLRNSPMSAFIDASMVPNVTMPLSLASDANPYVKYLALAFPPLEPLSGLTTASQLLNGTKSASGSSSSLLPQIISSVSSTPSHVSGPPLLAMLSTPDTELSTASLSPLPNDDPTSPSRSLSASSLSSDIQSQQEVLSIGDAHEVYTSSDHDHEGIHPFTGSMNQPSTSSTQHSSSSSSSSSSTSASGPDISDDAPLRDSFEEEFYYSYYYYSYLLGTQYPPESIPQFKSGRERYYALFPEILRNVGLGPSSTNVEQTFDRLVNWMGPICEENARRYVEVKPVIEAKMEESCVVVESSRLKWSLDNLSEAANAATTYHMTALGQAKRMSKPLVKPLPLPPPLAQESFANAWKAAHALRISPVRALQMVAYVCAKLSYAAMVRAEASHTADSVKDSGIVNSDKQKAKAKEQLRERQQVVAVLSNVPRVKGEALPLITSVTQNSPLQEYYPQKNQQRSQRQNERQLQTQVQQTTPQRSHHQARHHSHNQGHGRSVT